MSSIASKRCLWIGLGLLVVLGVPCAVFAQDPAVSALGAEAAKALDEARVDSTWGWIGAVVFVGVIGCAIGFRSLKLGILGVCIAIGVTFLYNGGTVARKVIPTTGARIVQ
jgi:hypothetical protein